MLSQVIDTEHPDHLVVAFDVKGGTFRNTMLPQYKGTRDAAPEDLLSQLPLIQRMLSALGVTYIEQPGYEGDDVIGTLATMGDKAGYRTLVLSGDRDAFQLINDNITVLYPGHHFKDLKHMTSDAVVEKYHVTPEQYPDLAALRGETADNIPGVPGVGDGFAAKWINQYGGLDQIIEHADEITGKKGEALRENIEQVKLNRSVNALVRDLELDVTLDDLTFGTVDTARLNDLFSKLEFGIRTRNRVLKTFNAGTTTAGVTVQPESNRVVLPEVMTITHGDELRTWVDANMPPADEHLHGDDEDANPAIDAGSLIGNTMTCTNAVNHSWVLQAEGVAKPGNASMASLMLMVNGKGAQIEHVDDSIANELQHMLDGYHRSMVVHGYKEQQHLLESVGITLPTPLFDTKLAGYLVHPDFHAESLEQAPATSLTCTSRSSRPRLRRAHLIWMIWTDPRIRKPMNCNVMRPSSTCWRMCWRTCWISVHSSGCSSPSNCRYRRYCMAWSMQAPKST